MPSKGRKHFDTYTEQNRVKHAILTKYFGVYLKLLGPAVDAFHYIDGFAGAGSYEGEHPGSPLVAIDLLTRQARPAAASFIESDLASYEQLKAAIHRAAGVKKLIEPPLLRCGEFSQCVTDILARPDLKRFARIATFAFVDPCGLRGLYMADIARILQRPRGECLVFLNYDGLNRWLGGVRATTHSRQALDRFFGNARAGDLALARASTPGPGRESGLLDIYLGGLRETAGARFILPFRFRASARERTSHYLIHLSQHPLAFTIMKDVMKKESAPSDDFGSFGFIPLDELIDQGQLFTPNLDLARNEVLDELGRGPQFVSHFTEEWPRRPHDMFVEREYRRLLLMLEEEGAVEILDPATNAVTPARARKMIRGATTLADRYRVQLRTSDTCRD